MAYRERDAGVCEPCESESLKRPLVRETAARGAIAGLAGAACIGLGLALGPLGLVLAGWSAMPVAAVTWFKLNQRAERARRRAYLAELRAHRELPAGG